MNKNKPNRNLSPTLPSIIVWPYPKNSLIQPKNNPYSKNINMVTIIQKHKRFPYFKAHYPVTQPNHLPKPKLSFINQTLSLQLTLVY